MPVLQKLEEKLTSKFTELQGFPAANFIFGYTQMDRYNLKAIAKKENDIISIRFLPLGRDFIQLSALPTGKVYFSLSLKWEIQHVYQSDEIPSTADYCWCGFHTTQHDSGDLCDQTTLEERETICLLMKGAETRLHRIGLCSNPINCDCSQTNIHAL